MPQPSFNAVADATVAATDSRRERDFLNRFAKPWRAQADDARTSQAAHQAALSWDDVEWFKATYPDYPLLLKGIATAEDAELAVELGVDGVCALCPHSLQLHEPCRSLALLSCR